MRGRAARALLGLLCLAPLGARPLAQGQPFPWQDQVGFDQRLGERLPLDARFVDGAGREIELGGLLGRRPVVLVFVYYECPMLCDRVLNGLVRGLRLVPLDAGKDFDVVAIGIDPGEPHTLAAAKRDGYAQLYDRPGAEAGWHFLVGEEPEIRRVADAAGFRYVYDPATDEYVHAAGVVLVTAEGVLSRYLLDVEFAPRDLRLGIVEAGQGAVGSAVDRALLYCFTYDASHGRYSLAIWRLLRAGGLLTFGLLGTYVVGSLVRERRALRRAGRGAEAGV